MFLGSWFNLHVIENNSANISYDNMQLLDPNLGVSEVQKQQ